MERADLKGKAVYLSGPMTGAPGYGREFERARMAMKVAGALWVYDPSAEVPADAPWHRAMMYDLHELTDPDPDTPESPYYDLLVALPGWRRSEGCLTEMVTAMAAGIPCAEITRWGKAGEPVMEPVIRPQVLEAMRHGD